MAAYERARATGFPSPAQGYEAKGFDFNEILAHNAPATYIMRASGTQFCAQGIFPGSLLVVDRSESPRDGSLAVIQYAGEFLCRRMVVKKRPSRAQNGDAVFFDGENEIPAQEAEIFGTVKAVITLL
jgi:DNA polymerase V